jgi:hypothetical protein
MRGPKGGSRRTPSPPPGGASARRSARPCHGGERRCSCRRTVTITPADAAGTWPDPVPDRGHREPLRHDAAAPRSAAVSVFHPSGSDGHFGQRLNSSLDAMMRADPAGRPGRRHEQGQPAAQREQDGEERNRPGCPAYQSDEQFRRLDNGTKRAQIGNASGYTHRSFRPDAVRHMSVTTAAHRPAVTHPDTAQQEQNGPPGSVSAA